MTPLLLFDRAHRCSAESRREQAIVAGGHPPALQMSEHERSRLLRGALLDLVGKTARNATDAAILTRKRRAENRFRGARGVRAFRDHHDREVPSAAVTLGNLATHVVEI